MIKYNNIIWNLYQGTLIPRVPPHTEVNLSCSEAKKLLSLSKAYLIRYTNEWERPGGMFWYVIKDDFAGMDELKSKYRTQIRRGLKNCTIKRVSREEIAANGYSVYHNALNHYNIGLEKKDEETFRENTLNSNYDNWAVYAKEDNRMIAYSQITILDDACNSTTTKFDPGYLRLRPSEALFFEINKYYLGEKNYLYVSNGSRSISHDTNIQDLLIQKLKFRKAYCKLNIYYRPDVNAIIKILYPIRKLIPKIQHKHARKLSALLVQEEIRRSYYDDPK
jgi:hypothetical protein